MGRNDYGSNIIRKTLKRSKEFENNSSPLISNFQNKIRNKWPEPKIVKRWGDDKGASSQWITPGDEQQRNKTNKASDASREALTVTDYEEMMNVLLLAK